MTGEVECAAAFLAKLPAPGADGVAPRAAPECFGDPIADELLFSMLVWEASATRAEAGLRRLRAALVDYNELRVCLPDEVAQILGDRYPLARERGARVRSALNDVYRREHRVSLEVIRGLGKREARDYLASLDGVPEFVASRVALIAVASHTFPVDDRTVGALIEAGALPEGSTIEHAVSVLDRAVRAGEMESAFRALEAWLEDAPSRSKSHAAKPAKPAARRAKAPAGEPVEQPAPKKRKKA